MRFADIERKIFDRAREILAKRGHVPTQGETVLKASAMRIERCDPMKKAERVAMHAHRKAEDYQANDRKAVDPRVEDREATDLKEMACAEEFTTCRSDQIAATDYDINLDFQYNGNSEPIETLRSLKKLT